MGRRPIRDVCMAMLWPCWPLRRDGACAARLLTDEAFRKDLLRRIAETGVAIEQALGSAQDVEGCVEADGSITVVQTRPQM